MAIPHSHPLRKAWCFVRSKEEKELLSDIIPLLMDEMNVLEVEIVFGPNDFVDYVITPNNKVLGPTLGKSFQRFRSFLQEQNHAKIAHDLMVYGTTWLEFEDTKMVLSEQDLVINTVAKEGYAAESRDGLTVIVDVSVDLDLIKMYWVRRITREVNNLRKTVGSKLNEVVTVYFYTDDLNLLEAVYDNYDEIVSEVLADGIIFNNNMSSDLIVLDYDASCKLMVKKG